jgi:hypothetical protein
LATFATVSIEMLCGVATTLNAIGLTGG